MAKRAWSPQHALRSTPTASQLREDFERDQETAFVEDLDAHGLRTQGMFQKSRQTDRKAKERKRELARADGERRAAARAARAERAAVVKAEKERTLQLGGTRPVPKLW